MVGSKETFSKEKTLPPAEAIKSPMEQAREKLLLREQVGDVEPSEGVMHGILDPVPVQGDRSEGGFLSFCTGSLNYRMIVVAG